MKIKPLREQADALDADRRAVLDKLFPEGLPAESKISFDPKHNKAERAKNLFIERLPPGPERDRMLEAASELDEALDNSGLNHDPKERDICLICGMVIAGLRKTTTKDILVMLSSGTLENQIAAKSKVEELMQKAMEE